MQDDAERSAPPANLSGEEDRQRGLGGEHAPGVMAAKRDHGKRVPGAELLHSCTGRMPGPAPAESDPVPWRGRSRHAPFNTLWTLEILIYSLTRSS